MFFIQFKQENNLFYFVFPNFANITKHPFHSLHRNDEMHILNNIKSDIS